MKAHLMFRERDFDPRAPHPAGSEAVVQDLGLETLFAAMASGDEFLLGVARAAMLTSLTSPAEIEYRQHILADCCAHPGIARELYDVAGEAVERERRIWRLFNRYPEALLHRSLEALTLFLEMLRKVKRVAEAHAEEVRSEGLVGLFDTLRTELDEAYLGAIESHVRRLGRRNALVLRAGLGEGNKAAGYTLHLVEAPAGILQRFQAWIGEIGVEHPSYHYEVGERDQAGLEALGEILSRGLSDVAIRTGHAADHVLGFFTRLRAEIGFYVGALNLTERLAARHEPIATPQALPVPEALATASAARASVGGPLFAASGLYDVALALSMDGPVVGNDVRADGKRLMVITGANRGGKTTFLRSLGQAQLMMQCGLCVPAQSYRASLAARVFTHFKREEDPGLTMGKLDEELKRMSDLIERVTAGSLLLCNESFASTNEREGSEIARQIVGAAVEAGVRVVFVTHLYDFARGLYGERLAAALFLRAERLADGRRTFHLVEDEPLPTSYGPDLYRRIFETGDEPIEAAGQGAE
ncbi:MAG: MutS-related protein [Steroidobacteraceae bacterium]